MAPLGNPQLKQSIIEQKDKEITALQAQLADREIEAKAKDLLIETQRAALTSQQWVIDSLKENLARAER